MARKFAKVPKDKKSGIPAKYIAGAKNKDKRRAEIKRTRRLYKRGLLTPAMMDKISEERSRG
jgi:hypothetical protein|tara:strand:- start:28 stop:213 length:186 start_codon:yes stop_codon:yes gene_type:complete